MVRVSLHRTPRLRERQLPPGALRTPVHLRAGRVSGRVSRRHFDDLETIAILASEGEHCWRAGPAQDIVSVDAAGEEIRMVRCRISRREPNARLNTGGETVVG